MKAVIFDMDGVIVDSEEIHKASIKGALEALGADTGDFDFNDYLGKRPEDYLDVIKSRYGLDPKEFLEVQKEQYYSRYDEVEVFDDFRELYDVLRLQPIKLALATSSNKDLAKRVMRKFGLVFDALVAFGDVKRRKPDPEPYLLVANRLGLPPSECIVIEDTRIGIISAKAAGMACICRPTIYSESEDHSMADHVVTSLIEVVGVPLIRLA